jgi:hypothetical protein
MYGHGEYLLGVEDAPEAERDGEEGLSMAYPDVNLID